MHMGAIGKEKKTPVFGNGNGTGKLGSTFFLLEKCVYNILRPTSSPGYSGFCDILPQDIQGWKLQLSRQSD